MRTLKKFAILLAIAIGFCTLNACSSKAAQVETETENYVPMFISFEGATDLEVGTLDSAENLDTDEIVGTISEENLAVITDCQEKVVSYFEKKDIDVAPQIEKLENVYIYKCNYTSDGSSVSGYYKPGTFDVYLNEDILSDEDYLKFTYTHEVMHYLFSDDENMMMQEGMADAIAEDILGYHYELSYDVPRNLCHQIMVADSEILSYLINDGGSIDDRIDTMLENVPREWYVEKHDLKLSEVLDVLLYQIEYAELLKIDFQTCEGFVNQCQEIIIAYVNEFELTEKQLDEIYEYIVYFNNNF